MKLCYWGRADKIPNFGDVLNPFLWNNLLPNLFDENVESIFVGIGTLLEKGMGETLNIQKSFLHNDDPLSKYIIVFGSGAGYSAPPELDSRWNIYCVRGPLTANLLGIESKFSVTDPAILVRRIYREDRGKKYKFSLMPHHSSSGPVLKSICEEIGFHYIDPLGTIVDVLSSLSRTDVLLTEALHGAIVADALRTHWVPIRTHTNIFSFKWEDWCKSVSLEYRPTYISDIINYIWPLNPNARKYENFKRKMKLGIVERNLKKMALNASPILSKDSIIENLTQELGRVNTNADILR